MKVLSVVGARPQFIKEAALQVAMKPLEVEEVLVHTGQHYDTKMSDVFFETLGMNLPKYNLGIISNLHGEMTGKMLSEIEKIIINEKPELVIVYGDTNSTVAGALAASKLKVKVAHIEAGVRQKKPKGMPEETNRVITDHISDYLFAPSQLAVDNLKKEAINENIHFVGDIMYDIFKNMKGRFSDEILKKYQLKSNEFIVMTLHRDFNVDDPVVLKSILEEIQKLSKQIKVVYPIHPRTKKRIQSFGFEKYLEKTIITDPLDYLELMGLTANSFKVITDSGGFQKEAYFAGKQALVLMPETGWSELIESEWNTLCRPQDIYEAVFRQNTVPYPRGIYGEGDTAKKIMDILNREIYE